MTSRREFVTAMVTAAGSAAVPSSRPTQAPAAVRGPVSADRAPEWRAHFPFFGRPGGAAAPAYLDTAATSQRPHQVIDAIAEFYRHDNANPGATLHAAARAAHARYEGARSTLARFIGARDPLEIVFTRGTTEGVNLVAAAWGGVRLKAGDEILLGRAEHASNMVPWQLVARRTGATIRWFGIDTHGRPDLGELRRLAGPRTRIVAFSHVSNVLGFINPVREMCDIAHRAGALAFVDGAQSAPHIPVDVQALDCDFFAFSGHKMMGPMGSGVLWARRALLEEMPPYHGGSNMAHDVDLDGLALSDGAMKFGAGTPNVAGAAGLAAAVEFIGRIGWDALVAQERLITSHALDRLTAIDGLRLIGPPAPESRIAVFAFTVRGMTAKDVVRALDERGVQIRGGDLASLPLLKTFGVTSAARASCYLYTTLEEIDRLADALQELARGRTAGPS